MTTPIQNRILSLMGNPKTSASPVAGYTAWYAPDSLQQSAGVVTSWSDKSVNAKHFGTAHNSPVYTASAINGNAGMTLTAASSMYLSGTPTLTDWVTASAYTIYAVFQVSAACAAPGVNWAAAGAPVIYGVNNQTLGMSNRGGPKISIGHNDGSVQEIAGANYGSQPQTLATEVYYDGTNMHLRSFATDSTPVAAGNVNSLTPTILCGASENLSTFFDGIICELIFYKTTLSGANLTNNRNYINAKYGISM